MEADYSKRELDTHFQSLETLIKSLTEHQNIKLDRIETQVLKTNGRVSALEKWKDSVMAKWSALVAGIVILWTLTKEFLFK